MIFLLASGVGLLLGSFYASLSSRIVYFVYGHGKREQNRWRKIFFGRSFCMHCREKIQGIDLWPIIGYLKNSGRCRHCRQPIGLPTFAAELYPALLLPLLLYSGYSWAGSLFSLLFCLHLYISIATDTSFLLLDHENGLFLLLWAAAALLENLGPNLLSITSHLLASGGALLFFGLLFLLGRGRGLGFGDVILASILALYSGLPWSLFIFQLAAIGSIAYILFVKRDWRAPAPLGAALALATLIITPVKHIIATDGGWIILDNFTN